MTELEELRRRKNDLEKQIKQLTESLKKTEDEIEKEVTKISLNLVGSYLKLSNSDILEGEISNWYLHVISQEQVFNTSRVSIIGTEFFIRTTRKKDKLEYFSINNNHCEISERLDMVEDVNDFCQLFPGWDLITEEEFKRDVIEVIEKANDFVKSLFI